MQVKGIDHVNIIAADLDETVRFYGDLLGLRRGDFPGTAMGVKGAWLLDALDRPIIHVAVYDPQRHGEQEWRSMPTGSIDHVALICEDFDGTVARCDALGIAHRVNIPAGASFRQIVVTDPNNIKIELNFAGD